MQKATLTRLALTVKRPVQGAPTTVDGPNGAKLEVARGENNPRLFVLQVQGERRVRFADYWREALDDVEHFLTTGALPRQHPSTLWY